EPFQRSDLVRTEVRDRHQAGAHGRAVDEHRAGAALPTPTTEFRAIELEIVAQHVEELRIPGGRDGTGRPIDLQADGHRDAPPHTKSWGVAGVVRPGFYILHCR